MFNLRVRSVRVSNELGAGKAHAARSVLAVSVVIGLAEGTVMACIIYSLRDVWGWAFTTDVEVVQHVAFTAPYLAALALLYAFGAILSGMYVRQQLGSNSSELVRFETKERRETSHRHKLRYIHKEMEKVRPMFSRVFTSCS